MNALSTSEDVLLFISETMQPSENIINLDSDDFATDENHESLFLDKIANFSHPRFASIPFWANSSIRGTLWCLTIVLNILVIRFYSKQKGSTRSNILALAYVDVIFAAFSVFVSLIQLLFVGSLVYNIFELVQFSIELVVFSNYLYPSLFLAIDRLIAVAFPHKVKDLSRKVRPIKWGLLVLNVLVISSLILMRFIVLPGSQVVYLILNPLRFVLLCVQRFGTPILYTTIVVLLLRSDKTLGHAVHG